VEDESISSLECWNLSEAIELTVLCADALSWDSLNDVELEAVGFSNCLDRGGSWVVLTDLLAPKKTE